MKQPSTYLDHSATTPLHPEVLEAMLPYLQNQHGNPGSLHRDGRLARQAIERAREQVATLINAEPREIIFTGSGTEANNLISSGFGSASQKRSTTPICSTVEHHSMLLSIHPKSTTPTPAEFLIPVNQDGITERHVLVERIQDHPRFVSVMWANNETGTLQPIAEIAQTCQEYGVPFHSDAVQALGKLPIDANAIPFDALTLSAHKINGPKGVGACYLRQGTHLQSLLRGGPQERNYRAGTENVAGIVGFGEACRLAHDNPIDAWSKIEMERDKFESIVTAQIKGSWVNGSQSRRLPNISNIGFDGLEGESIMRALDAKGFAISTGSACSSGSLDPSHVLLAMGQSYPKAHGAIRISLGISTQASDLARLADCLPSVIHELRSTSD